MAEDPDRERLLALEARIEKAKRTGPSSSGALRGIGQGEAAWRMVVELVAGMAIGVGIGMGLDTLFGTRPVMIVIFAMLGFAAGIKVMLGTAAALTKQDPGAGPEADKRG